MRKLTKSVFYSCSSTLLCAAISPTARAAASVVLLAGLTNFRLVLTATAAPVTVAVGDAGNSPDQSYTGQGQFGAVPYDYRIAIHEVTNSEYAAFLNFKVSIYYDPFYFSSLTFNDSKALLNESMLYDSRGGLNVVNLPTPCYSGGGFCPPPTIPYFQVRANMGDKPVNFVSGYDALRFVNWLNNGQSSSSTETGVYTLGTLGAAGVPVNPNAITRNPGATWVLPNEDEWYKAAYYQPAAAGGDSDGYWLSPTRSNVASAVYATANSTGNISNPGANVMNESGASWYGLVGNVTTVGSAGPLSASYYGTFDQGGNVQEWLESLGPGGRVLRGGSWDADNNIGFRAHQRSILAATYESADLGFRVAQLVPNVPEPATLALAALGLLGLAARRARREFTVVTWSPDHAKLATAGLPSAREKQEAFHVSARRGDSCRTRRLMYLCLVGVCLASAPARADIFQWEYINPANPSLGKQQSATLCPGGADVNAVPAASLYHLDLTKAYLIGKDLTSAYLASSNLSNAELSQATATNANFSSTSLNNANLSQANLTNVNFGYASLFGTNFSGAIVRGAGFINSGFTPAQLYSTGSYLAHDLTGIGLQDSNFAGANLSQQNLTSAGFSSTNLTNANLSQANLTSAGFGYATLTGTNLRQANLTNAGFGQANLTGADLTDAEIRGAGFAYAGITPAQLYSTASYKNRDLTGIQVWFANFSGANLAGQNLTNADLQATKLTGANFTGAELRGAKFTSYMTPAQLYSTASYQAHDLTGISFDSGVDGIVNFTGIDLSGQKLTNVDLAQANLTGANLTNAVFTGATTLQFATLTGADARGTVNFFWWGDNLIQSDGLVSGLDANGAQPFLVRDFDSIAGPPIPIHVGEHFAASPGGTVRMVLEADAWDSTISFAPGIPVARGGTLELTFADGVNLANQVGRTFDLFNWTGVSPTGTFTVASPYVWDLTNLYTTGEVTLTAIPGLPGDLSQNGSVDAADYVLLRKSNASPAEYDEWRAHFGTEAFATPPPKVLYARGTWNGFDQSNPLVDQGGGLYEVTVAGLTPGALQNFKVANADYSFDAPLGAFNDGRLAADANGEIKFHFWESTAWSDGWFPSHEPRVGYDDPNQFDWELMGSFNGWSAGAEWFMTDEGSGLHRIEVALASGSYEFKFRKQGDWGISIGYNFGNSAANATTGVIAAGIYAFELDLPNGRWRVSAVGSSSSAAIPEPATLALLVFAAAGWCLRRYRAAQNVS